MPRRLQASWIVLDSRENSEGTRCVDFFVRPDDTYGFEEFRKDPEDGGTWTPVQFYSGLSFQSRAEAVEAAARAIRWFDP